MSTRPKLAVILGAGASHDVCPYEGPIKDLRWKPPLVKTMFEGSALDEVLARHPEAAALMSSVRTDVRAGATFEQSLRGHLNNPNPYVQRQMASVPIALHEFFYLVSTNYTNEAVNYSHLVNRTIGQGIHTAYITVNYDTLLESSLARVTGVQFNTVESYTSSPNWILVKLHGSVGWGYPWDIKWQFVTVDRPRTGIMRNASLTNPPPEADPSQIRLIGTMHAYDPAQESYYAYRGPPRPYYPAMALPVQGKYGFVCPPSHVEALRSFLAECKNFLFIGFSANDQDLLDLLKDTVQTLGCFHTVADGGSNESQAMAIRLMEAVPKFRGPYLLGAGHFEHGFTAYLGDKRGLDWLTSSLAHG